MKNIEGFVKMVNEAKKAGKSWDQIFKIVNESKILGTEYSSSGVRHLYNREKSKYLDPRLGIIRGLREKDLTWDEVGIEAAKAGITGKNGNPFSGGGIHALYCKIAGIKKGNIVVRKNDNTLRRVVSKKVNTPQAVERAVNSLVAKKVAEIGFDPQRAEATS